jgi:hypothetical protein
MGAATLAHSLNHLRLPGSSPQPATPSSAAALASIGRLAGGAPSIWKSVRALKLRPGTLRVGIAGDYRLHFETGPGDTLRLVGFILRRDLDRWLAKGGR